MPPVAVSLPPVPVLPPLLALLALPPVPLLPPVPPSEDD